MIRLVSSTLLAASAVLVKYDCRRVLYSHIKFRCTVSHAYKRVSTFRTASGVLTRNDCLGVDCSSKLKQLFVYSNITSLFLLGLRLLIRFATYGYNLIGISKFAMLRPKQCFGRDIHNVCMCTVTRTILFCLTRFKKVHIL